MSSKNVNIYWFQVFSYNDLQHFFDIYDNKLKGFWVSFGLLETVMTIFHKNCENIQ